MAAGRIPQARITDQGVKTTGEGRAARKAYGAPDRAAVRYRNAAMAERKRGGTPLKDAAARWAEGIEQVYPCVAGRFRRPEPRRRALESGVPFGWVAGDEVYGSDRNLRLWLEREDIAHLLAIKSNEKLWAWTDKGPGQVRADRLASQVEEVGWNRCSQDQT